jgi:transposase
MVHPSADHAISGGIIMQSSLFVGVDVARAEVVVAWADGHAPVRSLANTRRALGAWLDTLPHNTCVGVESSGRYHELLVALACARGLKVYLLNPYALHHYAKALHRGRKTDRLDAELIAHYLSNEHGRLRPYSPPSALVYELFKLQRRRASLVAKRASVRLSLDDCPELSTHTEQVLQAFEQLISAIDHNITRLIASDPQRAELAQRLRSLPGFGPLNSNHFATLLPRIAAPSADACIAYTGMDLRPRDSGAHRGKRKLTKHGPAETRRLLYLAAQAAARSNPHWKALYLRLLDKGRSKIEATVILARKLLRIAHHLYRSGDVYNPELFAKNAGLTT